MTDDYSSVRNPYTALYMDCPSCGEQKVYSFPNGYTIECLCGWWKIDPARY